MIPIGAARAIDSGILQTAGFVEYTICSRGRPIGTSDLGFVRIDGSSRSGWFHPNAFGESVMPTVALVYPAMRAFICQDVRDDKAQSTVQPDFRTSAMFADLAEAYHRVGRLELTLHWPDGTLIPTSMLGIQDCEELLKFSIWRESYRVEEALFEAESWYDLEPGLQESSSEWDESDDELEDLEIDVPWAPDEDVPEFPRYQVHLLLSEVNTIP